MGGQTKSRARGPARWKISRNIGKLMTEIDDAVGKGEASWGWANSGALSFIRCWVEHLDERGAARRCPGCGEISTAADCESASKPGQWYCQSCWNDRVTKFEKALNR